MREPRAVRERLVRSSDPPRAPRTARRPRRAPRPPRMPWRKLLLALAALAAGLALAEGGFRAVLGLRGRSYSRAAAAEELASLRDFASNFAAPSAGGGEAGELDPRGFHRYAGQDVLHPFHAFDHAEGTQQLAADLAAARERPDELRVAIAGGSVAAIFGKLGTARLEAKLREDPRSAERPIRFLRYGRAASKQPQQLMLVADLISLGADPAVVIELDGFNEVAIGSYNQAHGMHPTYPSRDKWLTLASGAAADPEALELAGALRVGRERLLERVEALRGSPLLASALFGELALRQLRGLRGRIAEGQQSFLASLSERELPSYLFGPPFHGDAHDALELVADHWRECSYSMHLLCEARGITYLHVLQPALHDGKKPLTPEEERDAVTDESWVRGVQQGYPMLRERARELVARGVRFHDASGVFEGVTERIYRDSCHFGERGNELLADEIAAALLAALPEK